jgi:protein tyrosine phosphatase (PTP) superfamily phosphohydrolase (DUF442 family)/GNAT superfamily N-acetyltransferase
MALTDIRNFVDVDGRIGTAGQPTEAQLHDVAAAGYRHVINLGLLDPKYCLADEAGSVGSLGVGYQHIPVTFDAPTFDNFLRFADAMERVRADKVFVHCAMNYRVSSFMSLYGQSQLGWSVAQADDLVSRLWAANPTWSEFIARCRQMFSVTVRPATPPDAPLVTAILHEAAAWLDDRGQSMWRRDELDALRTAAEVAAGQFYVAEHDGEPAGVARFQFEDQEFWPDEPAGESVFVHRLAVRRAAAGREVATCLLAAARSLAVAESRRFLRLDCEASRPRLRQFYERFGFRHHSDRQVGPYFVSRYQIDIAPGRLE